MDLIVIHRFWIGRATSDTDTRNTEELWLWYDTDRWYARAPAHVRVESLSSPRDAAEKATKDWVESGGPPSAFGGRAIMPGCRFATTDETYNLDQEHHIEKAIREVLFQHEPGMPASGPCPESSDHA